MRDSIFVFFFVFLVGACTLQEEDISTSSSLVLTFSDDTVLFDTLLTNRSSISKRLRIYNQNENAVRLSSIRLGMGESSRYSIIVNGKPGVNIEDEVIFGGDSLLVLLQVTIDPQDSDLPYLVKDSLLVNWNGNQVHVKLVAWGQDAIYLNETVVATETWDAKKPYVIRDFVFVDTSETLTIPAGARVFLDNDASLFVAGSLHVLGDTADQVVFRNTRFDENYLEAPGQWGAIFFLEGSTNNVIDHAIIENGTVGLRAGMPDDDQAFDLTISNTSIRHMSSAGILAFTSDIDASNVEVYNSGQYLIGNFAGGTYRYRNCTFSNQPSFFIVNDPVVQFSDNVVLENDQVLAEDLSVTLLNSIVWGGGSEQLLISNGGGARLEATVSNNIIRSTQNNEENFTSSDSDFPGFTDPGIFDYSLDSLAFARNRADSAATRFDILGKPRGEMPDIGAYEFIEQ